MTCFQLALLMQIQAVSEERDDSVENKFYKTDETAQSVMGPGPKPADQSSIPGNLSCPLTSPHMYAMVHGAYTCTCTHTYVNRYNFKSKLYLPQLTSSEPSKQSLAPSQSQLAGIHLPLSHCQACRCPRHVCSAGQGGIP